MPLTTATQIALRLIEDRKRERKSYDLANGIEDGIAYKVTLMSPVWVAIAVTKSGEILTTSRPCIHEPRFGVDAADMEMCEQMLEELIKKAKEA
jgi:hypothetical protein